MFEVADLFNLGVEWAWVWLRAQGDNALLFILLSAVSQMPQDHPLPLSPMHLRRERHPQLLQLPPALLGHPHRHPHCVLGLLHLWEAGHSRRSAGPLKQPSKLRSWPGNLMAEGVGRGVYPGPCTALRLSSHSAARSPGSPSLSALALAWEEDAQIGPRRVR